MIIIGAILSLVNRSQKKVYKTTAVQEKKIKIGGVFVDFVDFLLFFVTNFPSV